MTTISAGGSPRMTGGLRGGMGGNRCGSEYTSHSSLVHSPSVPAAEFHFEPSAMHNTREFDILYALYHKRLCHYWWLFHGGFYTTLVKKDSFVSFISFFFGVNLEQETKDLSILLKSNLVRFYILVLELECVSGFLNMPNNRSKNNIARDTPMIHESFIFQIFLQPLVKNITTVIAGCIRNNTPNLTSFTATFATFENVFQAHQYVARFAKRDCLRR
ncbi:hypothetical protein LguiA_030674 [Lonicera macranthoides]